MENAYFDFSKFVDDLEKRQSANNDRIRHQAEIEHANKTRDLNRLYREHPLSRTYSGGKDD